MDDATFSCEDSCLYANDGECDEDQVRPRRSRRTNGCLATCCVDTLMSPAYAFVPMRRMWSHVHKIMSKSETLSSFLVPRAPEIVLEVRSTRMSHDVALRSADGTLGVAPCDTTLFLGILRL